jgi:hypothetical protein
MPYLVKVDDWLPEVVSLLVEISHSDLSKVTWMVLVHVRSVVMLTTSKTTTTGMLAVLAYTTVSSRDMAATVERDLLAIVLPSKPHPNDPPLHQNEQWPHHLKTTIGIDRRRTACGSSRDG